MEAGPGRQQRSGCTPVERTGRTISDLSGQPPALAAESFPARSPHGRTSSSVVVAGGCGERARRLVGPNRKYHPSGRRKQNRNNSRFVELEEFPRLKLLPGLGAKVDDQERRLYKASIPYNPGNVAFRAISKHQDRTFLEL